MKTKLFTMIIILIVGVIAINSAKAESYGKTFTVNKQDTALNVENFILYIGGTGGLTMSNTNHIKVKNGVEFFIQLPENHNVNGLSSVGKLEGDSIRVLKAGSLTFSVTIDGKEYYILAHVNYFGVLQYEGADLKNPDTIVIKEDKDLNTTLSIPDPEDKITKDWSIIWQNGNEYLTLHEETNSTVKTMTLQEIITKIKHNSEIGGSEWTLQLYFNDRTSNSLPNGEHAGSTFQFITIKDERVVIVPPTIRTSSLPKGKEGESYSVQLEATGTAPITWSLHSGNLPSGLVLSESGLLSGTPTEFGTFTFVVKATNEGGSAQKEFTLVIAEKIVAPTIRTSSLPKGKEGESYSVQLEATGTAPITWSIVSGSLPAGLSLSSDGLLSGTPTEFGTFTFTVKAKNAGGSAQKDFTLVIAEKEPVVEVPTIRTSSLPEGKEGVGYREKLEAIGTAPITWSLHSGNLPSGLVLSESGLLSGTPTEFGTFTFTVKAKNAGGENEKEFTLVITEKIIAPTITTTSLPEGKEGVGYREKLEAIGTAPITWSIVSGSLPAGLSLSSDGLLSGTPKEFGTFTFTVRAKNAGGENEKEFFLTINKNTGIESLYQDEKIFVADGILQVMLSESGILSVYSLSGELILQKDFNYEVEVLLPHNNQIFILSIKTPTRSIYDKVIK